MAQGHHYIRLYSTILLGFCFVIIRQVELNPTVFRVIPKESDTRKCLLRTAKSQLHVREMNSNRGKEVEKYLASCSLKVPNPYCGAFLKWLHDQCGIQVPIIFPARASNWFTDRKRTIWKLGHPISPQSPQEGDIAGFDFRTKDKVFQISHVELVWEWEDDEDVEEFYTIGANTSAPRGVLNPREGVHLKERNKDQAIVVKVL
ncbi:MAG: hypothetical protein U0Y10_04605 [Spirosomataceae bacterium]